MKAALVRRALPRAIFHAAAGIIIVGALYTLPLPIVLAALAFGTIVFFAIDLARLRTPALQGRFTALFAPLLRKEEDRRITGASYFLVGCLLSVAAFRGEIAVMAVLFLSIGDPAATIIGIWKGRIRLWGKSIEGDAACLVVCLAIAVLVAGIVHRPPMVVSVTGAAVASLFQALRLPVNDNLTIPVGSGLSMIALSALMG